MALHCFAFSGVKYVSDKEEANRLLQSNLRELFHSERKIPTVKNFCYPPSVEQLAGVA